MPEITPARFFRFAAEHNALLADVYYRRDLISEADLFKLIRSNAQPGSPSAQHVLEQLIALGFMESAASASAEFEMTRHVAGLLDVLLRQHRLTSVQVIQAYVDTIQTASSELVETVNTDHGAQTVRVLNELSDSIERLRQDSRNNRDAIIAAAVRAKVNAEQASVQERFAEINRLWKHYIVPLRDMVDESKVLDSSLDKLERNLEWSRTELESDPALTREIDGAQARLLRMRREVSRDFHESIREISPLYHDLRRDTRLVRGAALFLDRADRQGHRALTLDFRMALSVWRREGRVNDEELRAYLYQMRDYVPGERAPLAHAADGETSSYIEPGVLEQRIRRHLPIADAWAWVLTEFPEASTAQILRTMARILRGDHGPTRQAGRPRSYRTLTHEITAYPLEVVAHHD